MQKTFNTCFIDFSDTALRLIIAANREIARTSIPFSNDRTMLVNICPRDLWKPGAFVRGQFLIATLNADDYLDSTTSSFQTLRRVSVQPVLNRDVIGFHPSYVGFGLLYRLLHRSCRASELSYVLVRELQQLNQKKNGFRNYIFN